MHWHSISEAARRSGLGIDTLRYYETIGLIRDVGRTTSGHRRYSEDDLEWLAFLSRLRATDMPVVEMLEYVHLVDAGDETLAARRALIANHRQTICRQIAALEETLEVIDRKLAHYDRLAAGIDDGTSCSVRMVARNRLARPTANGR